MNEGREKGLPSDWVGVEGVEVVNFKPSSLEPVVDSLLQPERAAVEGSLCLKGPRLVFPHPRSMLSSGGPSPEPSVELDGRSTQPLRCEGEGKDGGREERPSLDLLNCAEEWGCERLVTRPAVCFDRVFDSAIGGAEDCTPTSACHESCLSVKKEPGFLAFGLELL